MTPKPYETLLTNGMAAGYPTKPGTYLWKASSHHPRVPFCYTHVRRRWWLFGSLGFASSYGWNPVTKWTVEQWRVPRR